MTKFFDPDYTLSEAELQDDFLYYSYCRIYNVDYAVKAYYSTYRRNRYAAYAYQAPSLNNDQKALIHELYFEGFNALKVIQCSFHDFEIAMINQKSVYPGYLDKKHAKRKNSTFYGGVYFRTHSKYVRNVNHAPKTLTEADVDRQDWREAKGFDRDYRRQARSSYGGRKTNSKKWSNRNNRRHEKKLIQMGEYDKLNKQKDKLFFDPWDWD